MKIVKYCVGGRHKSQNINPQVMKKSILKLKKE